jgi:hypothetical protein
MPADPPPIGTAGAIHFMSIIAFPGPGHAEPHSNPSFDPANVPAPCRSRQPTRRRGTLEQGRALEALGHAVEYLVDSRLFHAGELNPVDEHEAVQILMRLSRAVFAECPEVVSLRRRMRQWVAQRFAGDAGVAQRG